jgi:CDP-diacylglycerol--serine O-phosphatidyltransferase
MQTTLPYTGIDSDDISVFTSAHEYKKQLLTLIAGASQRIFITALYLQDDNAGREILAALYQAKQRAPNLDIKLFVDYHRAQRGLIGEKQQLGNRASYNDIASEQNSEIEIYGVAVKSKELLGVLHLKGMIFDDILFYSGASINDIYLQQQERYRLDRYYQINSKSLSDGFCHYLSSTFLSSGLAERINKDTEAPVTRKFINKYIKAIIKPARYQLAPWQHSKVFDYAIKITPLVGYGKRRNVLNTTICQLIKSSEHNIFIFTPYFNLPQVVTKQLIAALKRGVKITLIIGDKKANDFYIADQDKFSTIGIIPYIYETILFRFVKRWQKFITSQQLTIKLWSNSDNSFHLKGLVVDEKYHLLTGSNLNPRAWGLDLENGLLLEDKSTTLQQLLNKELVEIEKHTTRVTHYHDIEQPNDYPLKPKKLLKRLRLSKIDQLLKRLL